MLRWRPTPDPGWAHIDARLTRIEALLTAGQSTTNRKLTQLMSSQESINTDVAQLTKALGEIRGLVNQQVEAIATLQAQIDAGSGTTVDLTALSDVTQQLDDIVPDAPPAT